MAIGLYIHIPFCLKKCYYCDFTSYPIAGAKVDAYLDALKMEMAFYHRQLGKEDLKLKTLYLGGGTPTCLSSQQLRQVFEASRRFFSWLPDMEITVEANPGTVSPQKLEMLKTIGVNRLSLGVQSLNPNHLIKMGRQHGVEEIKEAVAMARQAGFTALSLDLIYGLPEQTLGEWQETLMQALLLSPEHLSAYGLKIERGTPWGELEAAGKIKSVDDDLARLMYDEVQEQCLRRGYRHYEISNFAQPGYESRHNCRYWLTEPYLGLGVAASSFLLNKRWTNVGGLKDYAAALRMGKAPVENETTLNRQDQMSEMLFLGLRLLGGVPLNSFRRRFGVELMDIFSHQINKLIEKGLVVIQDRCLRLTPFGLPLANEVFQAFL